MLSIYTHLTLLPLYILMGIAMVGSGNKDINIVAEDHVCVCVCVCVQVCVGHGWATTTYSYIIVCSTIGVVYMY